MSDDFEGRGAASFRKNVSEIVEGEGPIRLGEGVIEDEKNRKDDKEDEEVLDAACGDCEWGIAETSHGENINCAILGVRYNKNKHIIEAFMKDFDDNVIDEWVSINFLSIDARISVYVTILEYIDQAKELCS